MYINMQIEHRYLRARRDIEIFPAIVASLNYHKHIDRCIDISDHRNCTSEYIILTCMHIYTTNLCVLEVADRFSKLSSLLGVCYGSL
jgi:hypothetical protein